MNQIPDCVRELEREANAAGYGLDFTWIYNRSGVRKAYLVIFNRLTGICELDARGMPEEIPELVNRLREALTHLPKLKRGMRTRAELLDDGWV